MGWRVQTGAGRRGGRVLKEVRARKQPFCGTCTYPKKASSFSAVPLASTSFSFLPSCRVPYDIPPCRTHPPPPPSLSARGGGGDPRGPAKKKREKTGGEPARKKPR